MTRPPRMVLANPLPRLEAEQKPRMHDALRYNRALQTTLRTENSSVVWPGARLVSEVRQSREIQL